MNDRAGRWAFLKQRLAPLVGRVCVYSPDSIVYPAVELTLAVDLPSGNPSPSAQARFRKAVVLLALAKRVDTWAWDHILPAYCGVYGRQQQALADAKSAHYSTFKVTLCGHKLRGEGMDQAAERIRGFFASDPTRQDRSFLAAVEKIPEVAGAKLAGSSMDIPVTLDTKSFGRRESGLNRWWTMMEELRDNYGGQRFPVPEVNTKTGLDCAFVFGAFDLEFLAGKVDEGTLTLAQDIAAKNTSMGLSEVFMNPQFEDEHNPSADEIRVFGGVVECVICGSRCSPDEQAAKGLVRIGYGQEPSVGFARICSALANTQTVGTAEMLLGWSRVEPASRVWIWKWVAFALFSDYAVRRSSITGVKLSMGIMMEADVDAIAEVLSSPDPIGVLVPRDEGDAGGGDRSVHAAGVLKRGAWVKLLPMDIHDDFPPESSGWALSYDIHGVVVVDTVSSSPEHVRAIVPGYGLCQVRRVDVVPDTDTPRSSGPVTSLHLGFASNGAANDGPKRFLQLVGAPLTRLSVDGWSERRIPVAHIVRCCPKLKCLQISDGHLGIGAFLEAYRNSDVEIEEIKWTLDVDSIYALVAELSDGNTRLAKTLKRLDCTWEEGNPSPGPTETSCIADMLERNRTLEYLRVHFYYDKYEEDETAFIQTLERFDHELLPFASEPFPLRSRLAFLSVFSPRLRADRDVKRRTRGSDKPKLASLKTDVLSLIFEFAATRAVRHVHVTKLDLIIEMP